MLRTETVSIIIGRNQQETGGLTSNKRVAFAHISVNGLPLAYLIAADVPTEPALVKDSKRKYDIVEL